MAVLGLDLQLANYSQAQEYFNVNQQYCKVLPNFIFPPASTHASFHADFWHTFSFANTRTLLLQLSCQNHKEFFCGTPFAPKAEKAFRSGKQQASLTEDLKSMNWTRLENVARVIYGNPTIVESAIKSKKIQGHAYRNMLKYYREIHRLDQ